MRIHLITGAAMLPALTFLAGCQTAERGSTSAVKVYVQPAGAQVKTSLGDSCRAPCTLTVKRSRKFTVTASKKGYRSKTVPVGRKLNKKAAQKTATSLILPGGSALAAVDTLSGAFYDHHPNPVRIKLQRR